MHALDLVDARGQTASPWSARIVEILARTPQAQDAAWLAAAPLAASFLRLPWPALALNRQSPGRKEWDGTIQFLVPPEVEAPLTLRVYQFDRLKARVPFTLRELPLP
jgi:hypothetical protein